MDDYPQEIEDLLIQDDLDFLKEAFCVLDKMEQKILIYRFGLCNHKCHSLRHTAKLLAKYGFKTISGERVRQYQNRALKKLRIKFNETIIPEEKKKDYLEVTSPIPTFEEQYANFLQRERIKQWSKLIQKRRYAQEEEKSQQKGEDTNHECISKRFICIYLKWMLRGD